jgi:uncharacterized membrane protein
LAAAPSKNLHLTLWALQGLLALAMLGAGLMKFATPYDTLLLNPDMAWARSVPAWAVKVLGLVEALGAIGLVLPTLLRFRPVLTSWAAAGVSVVMIGAAGTHLVMGEPAKSVLPLVLAGLAAFVAWGRAVKAPIAPRAPGA